MEESRINYKFKITVIGDGMVGKTTLIKKFTKGGFQKDYVRTIGAQFSKFIQNIDDDICELIFWDIAGQPDFHFLRPSFYKGTKAAIIVYSLEENNLGKESLKNIKYWHNEIKRFCGNVPSIVFANKVDLVDENGLDDTKIKKIINKRKLLGYFRTSAKTGVGVDKAFEKIIKELYYKYKKIGQSSYLDPKV